MKKFILADYKDIVEDWSEYEELTPKQAILANCYQCCVYQSTEVSKCVSKSCPLWLLRKKWWKKPTKKRELTEEQKEAIRERFKNYRKQKKSQD